MGQVPSIEISTSMDTLDFGDSLLVINNSINFPLNQNYIFSNGEICPDSLSDAYITTAHADCNLTINGVQDSFFIFFQRPGMHTISLSAEYNSQLYVMNKSIFVNYLNNGGVTYYNCPNTHPASDWIYNGGFEDFHFCMWSPGDFGRSGLALSYQVTESAVCNWESTNDINNCPATNSCVTPDYFLSNSCIPVQPYSASPNDVPNNGLGCEFSHSTGSAYVGLYSYVDAPNYENRREYIEQELAFVMQPCHVYKLSFYISLAEFSGYKTNGIGAGFSDNWIYTNGQVHSLPARNIIFNSTIIPSTNWVLMELYYTAIGGEKYIIIGNMLNNSQVQVSSHTPDYTCSSLNPDQAAIHLAYYFIDDVSLVHYSSNPLTLSSSSNATCNGLNNGCATVTVLTGTGPFNYSWTPNVGNGPQVCNLAAGNYSVTVTDNYGCTASQTFIIEGSSQILLTPHSISACNGANNGCASVTATGGASPYSYSWSPNVGSTPSVCNLAPGTYAVMATDNRGCTSSTSIVINGSPSIAISTSSSSSCASSNAGCAHAIATGGVSPFTYSWTPNIGNTPDVCNLASGIYTVTATDNNGCTASQTVTVSDIQQNLETPIIQGPTSSCQNTPAVPLTYTISNWDPALAAYYTISIHYTDGTTISIQASQTFQVYFANGVGGTIIVSVGIAGTDCFSTSTFYVQECCSNGSSLIRIYDGEDVETALTSQGYGGNSQAYIQIFLSGTVVMNPNISGSYTFDNCILNFDPGSKLIIQGGSTVYFLNSHLQPSPECCMMWKGVEVASNSKIYFKAGSICEQAEYGITLLDKSSYVIDEAMFTNNYVSIRMGSGGYCTAIGNISRSMFTSSNVMCHGQSYSVFYNKYLGQSTTLGHYPYAGIEANYVSYVHIGRQYTTNLGRNEFSNLAMGIVSNGSNLVVDSCSFSYMYNDPAYFFNVGGLNVCGSGIYVKGGSLDVTGFGGQNNTGCRNSFSYSRYGICMYYSKGSITQNNSNAYVGTGVLLRQCRTVTIKDNTWLALYHCIRTAQNHNANFDFHNNHLYTTSMSVGGVACIQMDEYGIPGSVFNIYNNQLYLNQGRYGIYANKVTGAVIQQNHITLNGTQSRNWSGIQMNHCNKNSVLCNTVEAATLNNTSKGIRISSSVNNTISCNYVDKEFGGIVFESNCLPTDFKGNEFNAHEYALWFRYAGVFGLQTNKGNIWLNSSPNTWDSYNTGTLVQQNLSKIEFGLNPNRNFPITNNAPGQYSGPNAINDFVCDSFQCQPIITTQDYTPDDISKIINDSIVTNDYEEVAKYSAKKELLKYLRIDSSLLSTNPAVAIFYNLNIIGEIGQSAVMDQEIADAVKWDGTYNLLYIQIENDIKIKNDSIGYLNGLLNDSTSNTENVIKHINDLMKNVLALDSTRMVVEQVIKNIQDYKSTLIDDTISNANVNNVYIENEIAVNKIFLEKVLTDSTQLSASEFELIENIALQCPFEAGPAVYLAREIHSLFNKNITTNGIEEWDDEAICTLNGVPMRSKRPENAVKYVAYPNPSNGSLFIRNMRNFEDNQRITIMLLDGLGTIICRKVVYLKEGEAQIDVSNLSNGVYTVWINDEVGFMDHSRFILLK